MADNATAEAASSAAAAAAATDPTWTQMRDGRQEEGMQVEPEPESSSASASGAAANTAAGSTRVAADAATLLRDEERRGTANGSGTASPFSNGSSPSLLSSSTAAVGGAGGEGTPLGAREGDEMSRAASSSTPGGAGTPSLLSSSTSSLKQSQAQGQLGSIGKRMNDLSINAEDEDVQIAIAALGSMRSRSSTSATSTANTPAAAGTGTGTSTAPGSPSSSSLQSQPGAGQHTSSYRSSSSATSASASTSTTAPTTTTNLSGATTQKRMPGSVGTGAGAGQAPFATSGLRSRKRGGNVGVGAGSAITAATTTRKGKEVATSSDSSLGRRGDRMVDDDSPSFDDEDDDDDDEEGTRAGSTASAIITDEDGNPVRVQLDSEGGVVAVEGHPTPNTAAGIAQGGEYEEAFLQRFGKIPLVRGTLRAYELGKKKSRVVKYGAGLVETISRPVISRVGDALGEAGVQQLDGFARRQLDRIYPSPTGGAHSPESGAYNSQPGAPAGHGAPRFSPDDNAGSPAVPGTSARISGISPERASGWFSPTKEEREAMLAELEERERTEWMDMDEAERTKRRRAYWALQLEEKEREYTVRHLREKQWREQQQQLQQQGQQRQELASTYHPHPQGSNRISQFEKDGRPILPPPASLRARASQQQLAAANGASGLRHRGSSAQHHQQQYAAAPQQQHQGGDGRSGSPESNARMASDSLVSRGQQQQRSGWSGMLVEAGVTAGGLSAAMSEESLKSLKYCLQWLQYATAHIEFQITQLRDLIVKLNHGELDMASTVPGQHLAHIKGDVVNTIRGVVDVVGKYAGAALPAGARGKVREFILSLPARWATVNRTAVTAGSAAGSPNGDRTVAQTGGYFGGSPASPSFSPIHATSPGSPTGSPRNPQAAHAAVAANKVLTLAVESLDILRSVTVVFGESLDRADLWMERLRYLGLQRKRQHEDAAFASIGGSPGRIEMSPYGSAGSPSAYPGVTSAEEWERAVGQRMRSGSPDALSDISMASGTSSKRRKTRARSGSRAYATTSASPSSSSAVMPLAAPGRGPYGTTPEDSTSEDPDTHSGGAFARGARNSASSGYQTPEFVMSRSNSETNTHPAFVPGSSAGAPVAGSSTSYSPMQSHPHGHVPTHTSSSVAHRRKNRSAGPGKQGVNAGGNRSRPPSAPGTPNFTSSSQLHEP